MHLTVTHVHLREIDLSRIKKFLRELFIKYRLLDTHRYSILTEKISFNSTNQLGTDYFIHSLIFLVRKSASVVRDRICSFFAAGAGVELSLYSI